MLGLRQSLCGLVPSGIVVATCFPVDTEDVRGGVMT